MTDIQSRLCMHEKTVSFMRTRHQHQIRRRVQNINWEERRLNGSQTRHLLCPQLRQSMASQNPQSLIPDPSDSTRSPPSPPLHVFWHDGMLAHAPPAGVFDTGSDPGFLEVLDKHPENSDRVRNMVSILRKGPIAPYISWHAGRSASVSELLSFHAPDDETPCLVGREIRNKVWGCLEHNCLILKVAHTPTVQNLSNVKRVQQAERQPNFYYIEELVQANKTGGKEFCSGTFMNPFSWDACLLAAGTTLSSMKHLLDGHGKLAYALVRPPGHHAQPSQADGYCFLNNAGLAVKLALDSGYEKVAVIDIDVIMVMVRQRASTAQAKFLQSPFI
ncbi:histone deacetylase 8 [Iris pallida]|uniref:Histone deacetylase 8 n=1 Tax=Iris pallida TaxID=29817 RepID=A0AAX6FHC6_IRIPA|nr:histone deacetylase 8 [Iris pallida]